MTIDPAILTEYLARVPDWHLTKRHRSRLAKLIPICDSLPEVTLLRFGDYHLGFQIRKKTFAYFLNSHHDDDITCICCKSTLARQAKLMKSDPKRYLKPAYLGPSGWVSLRMDLAAFDLAEARVLLTSAYKLQAPKKLAESI
ncbi:MAG: MmcQ/YjbR family DNA-binding protein [Phycisphaerales bacterium]|nr:MmcQ/YjbR family DNA-binding protein [Phycisphaerales bacterium]